VEASRDDAAEARLQQYIPKELLAKLEAARASRSMEGERRIVTMLFCDVKGSTAMAEQLDPEEWTEIMNEVFEHLIAPVYHYEGTLARLMGDAILALFGAPIAHEDDPQRAVLAGLEIVQRMEKYQQRSGRELNVRVGINTGLVVVGEVGSDLRVEYTAMGDAVNLAARMEQTDIPGTIQVAESTYKLVESLFEFEPLGGIEVKGKSEPVTVYRVLNPRRAPGSWRGLSAYGVKTPLIGRDEELGELMRAFERNLRGRTQVVSLIGEAGAGKSRLVREFFERLQAESRLQDAGVRVWRAVCSSLGQQTYGVPAALVRDAIGLAEEDPADVIQQKLVTHLQTLGAPSEEINQMVPAISHLLGVAARDDRLRFLEPEQLKRQLILAVRNLMELELNDGPLILVVEDLHWADAASAETLRYLIERLGEHRLLLLLAHRPDFDPGALAGGRATHTAIRLAPLSDDASRLLLDAFFGSHADGIPDRVRELVVAGASGNPLYAEEIVRGLIQSGALKRDGDGWVCTTDVAELDVPPSVQGLLLARLDRLPPDTLHFAQEAAVIGSTFDETLLRAVCSQPESLDAHLDDLDEGEVVERLPRSTGSTSRYRFTHALVQEVAYQSILLRRRAALHGQVAETLKHMLDGAPERLEDLEALGHHFSLSDHKDEGARYLIAAGDRARSLYANEDAARHYERALEALKACDADRCRAEWLAACERLGDVVGRYGHIEDALARFGEALAVAEEAGDLTLQARLQSQIGPPHWDAGDRNRALAEYRAGLALLDNQTEHIELANLYQEMGRLAFRVGDNQQAVEWAERALQMSKQLAAGAEDGTETAIAMAQAYTTLGTALARLGRLDEAVQYVEQSLAVAQESELPQVACRAYTNLGVLYCMVDPTRAIRVCLEGLELARTIGDLGYQSRLYANLASAYCNFTGQCEDEGIAPAQLSIELDRQLGLHDHLAVPLIVLGQIYQCHEDAELALGCYREALTVAEDIREPQLLFPCYDGLATLYLDAGDFEEAEAYMRKGEQVCADAGVDADSLIVLPFLC
jgi:adenylate cyclase